MPFSIRMRSGCIFGPEPGGPFAAGTNVGGGPPEDGPLGFSDCLPGGKGGKPFGGIPLGGNGARTV